MTVPELITQLTQLPDEFRDARVHLVVGDFRTGDQSWDDARRVTFGCVERVSTPREGELAVGDPVVTIRGAHALLSREEQT